MVAIRPCVLGLFMLAGLTGRAQTFVEDFESGSGGYTTSVAECTDGSQDYFTLTDGSTISASFTGVTGSYFAAQDIDGCAVSSPQTIEWTGIDISGCTGLSLSVDLAEDDDGSNEDWDDSDFMHIDVSIDGGAYQNIIWVENDGSAFNSAPLIDTDFDGTGDGTTITDAFQTFTNGITGTGTTLDIRITIDLNSGDEDIAFDNLTIDGTGCSGGNSITTDALSPGSPYTVDCSTGDAVDVDFTGLGTFNAANVFTAQLSDASGSFASPVNIGTLALSGTDVSGTINATIPAGTSAGTQYRIRVVSDDPAVTGSDNGADLTINNSTATGTVIVNELSNGTTGGEEYVELLVIGTPCALVDIQNVIFDDNNGDFSGGPSAGVGIADGHLKFISDPQWGCIPTGTLITIYNDSDPNGAVPADDETDTNSDSIYILPGNSSYLTQCTTLPSTSNDAYTPCTYSNPAGWGGTVTMRNSGDAAQTRDASTAYMHGISYGDINGGPDNLLVTGGSGSGTVLYFDNSVDNDYTDINNFTAANASTDETPGAANTPENETYILSFRCSPLPVELLYFQVIEKEEKGIVLWSTASEVNTSHYVIERSRDGKNFEYLGTVQAAGNSSNTREYSFVDDSPYKGYSFYRLKQYDLNGEMKDLGTGSIHLRDDDGFDIVTYVHQGSELAVQVKGSNLDHLEYRLVSATGQLIRSGTGQGSILRIPVGLAHGIYVLQVSDGQNIRTMKVAIR